jgi:hypothetical protein
LIEAIRSGLSVSNDLKLVDELLASYIEAKRNFYLGGLRLSAVEGGRFCEATYRLLEQRTKGAFTLLGKQLDTERLSIFRQNLPPASQPDSIRLHIPRALRVVYDIRNTRDTAHLGDGIDPNLQDATLVVSVLDWVLSELVRLYHSVDANEAQQIVDSIVTRKAPAVQDFAGFLKVLNPNLPAGDFVILLLYQKGPIGADFGSLSQWVKPTMRKNLSRTLDQLTYDRAFVHQDSARYYVTATGILEVERRKLYELST